MKLDPGTFVKFIFSLTLLLTFTFSSHLSSAQESPKIGLVLSGGGAKGLAHIGILKALEEAGIRPDYITGTSMGSIMGGLYASGYSADEIKEIALSADWDQLLTNKLLLNEVTYEEKDYYERYLYEFNLRGTRPEMPKGLIEGQKLSMLLTKLTSHVSHIRDFNDLPIPFACIAADIENGEKVVLNKGSLALSMRASMSIPSIFTPVTLDDRLLVDGGLVHNFPVEENIDMGADYIIGVFVGTNLMKKEEMDSPVSVLTQSAFILSAIDNRKQKKLVDLYIEPDMNGYSGGDFHLAGEIIKIGERYGNIYLEEFKALKDSMEAAGWRKSEITKPIRRDSIFISEIEVVKNELVPENFIIDRLGLKENSMISITQLEEGITELYGTGFFNKILYDLKETNEGKKLEIDVNEQAEGKVRFGLQYDRQTGPSLLLHLAYRNLLLNNSRIILEGEIAENALLDFNYLKYFGYRQKFAFIGGYYFRNSEVPSISNGNVSGLLEYNYNKYYAGFHSSHRTNRILKLEYAYETAGINPKVVGEEFDYLKRIKFSSHNIYLKFEYNDLNHRYFPTDGERYGIYLKYTPSAKSFYRLQLADTLNPVDLNAENAHSLAPKISHKIVKSFGSKFSLGLQNAFYFNFIGQRDSLTAGISILNENYIGGFRSLAPNVLPFWAARPLQFYSENLYFNEFSMQYEFIRKVYFRFITQYFHAYYPLGFIIEDLKDRPYDFGGKKFLFGAGLSLSYYSPLGPLTFAVGKGNFDTPLQYWINLGFYFDRE